MVPAASKAKAVWILLRRPDFSFSDLSDAIAELAGQNFSAEVISAVQTATKYTGYIERQLRQVQRFRNLEDKPLPPSLDYSGIPGLRSEARERFLAVAPVSLGQAARIPGINPADIAVLMIHHKVNQPLPKVIKGQWL